MINDLLSDVLTRIRNANLKKYNITNILFNRNIFPVLELLIVEGFLKSFSYVINTLSNVQSKLQVVLAYSGQWVKIPKISKIINKNTHRLRPFFTFKKLKEYIIKKKKEGIFILSTNDGLMTDDVALKMQKGGRMLFYIK